jgi:glycosyltransferase involved in cell wall biosynthesis
MTAKKFSVLLPTRNRFELLKDAIQTVRCQGYPDWELIVADNCSCDNVPEYVAGLRDPRIVCIRSDKPVSVTENWNRALNASSGDYVIVLGDDDGLVPDYFYRLLTVIDKLSNPDFVYHGAYHFAFPGVLPSMPAGSLTDVTSFYDCLRTPEKVKLLACDEARALARASLDMRARFGFNMQHFLFSRRFLDRVAKIGPFFQGPFPDFYAANISMLTADRIGLLAEPMVIIGISPKSYGNYHFNNQEKEGISFLSASSNDCQTDGALELQLLPGTNMNSSWLLSVALIPRNLGVRDDLQPNVARYRRLQIKYNLTMATLGKSVGANLRKLWTSLNWKEKFFALTLKTFLYSSYFIPRRFRTRWVSLTEIFDRQYPRLLNGLSKPVVGRYQTVTDVYEDLKGKDLPMARVIPVGDAEARLNCA